MFHFCFTPNHPECPLQDGYFVDIHTVWTQCLSVCFYLFLHIYEVRFCFVSFYITVKYIRNFNKAIKWHMQANGIRITKKNVSNLLLFYSQDHFTDGTFYKSKSNFTCIFIRSSEFIHEVHSNGDLLQFTFEKCWTHAEIFVFLYLKLLNILKKPTKLLLWF